MQRRVPTAIQFRKQPLHIYSPVWMILWKYVANGLVAERRENPPSIGVHKALVELNNSVRAWRRSDRRRLRWARWVKAICMVFGIRSSEGVLHAEMHL